MKFTCERDKMLAAFQTAATVAPSRSPKPVLQNVKLVAGEQEATMLATDMEVGIRIDVPGIQVDVAGSVLLPVGRFGSMLRESTDAKLLVEVGPQGAVVRGERSEFKLQTQNPDEFPEVGSFQDDHYYEVPARLLRELVRRTLFATDMESSRYALGGVLLEFEGDKVTAVGTDGRRLAKMEGPVRSVGECEHHESTTIVPSRSMQLIERAFTDMEANIHVAVHANDVLLKGARATIYSRLVEGRFPKWRDVFPKRRGATQIEIAVGPLYSALRQASIVTSEESRGIDFAFGEGNLVLSGSTAEVGQTRVEFPILYEGPPITLSLDHRFVADFLKVLDPETLVKLEIEGPESAAVLTTEDGYGYVVMPLSRER